MANTDGMPMCRRLMNLLALCAICVSEGASKRHQKKYTRYGCITGKDIRWSTLVEDPQYFPYGVPCRKKYRRY
jgi:hypothetical protein